jgi:hypothetical protein
VNGVAAGQAVTWYCSMVSPFGIPVKDTVPLTLLGTWYRTATFRRVVTPAVIVTVLGAPMYEPP